MTRSSRITIPAYPHHITQRENNRANVNWTVGLGGFCVAIGIERFLTSACAVAGPYFIAAAMMVLLVFVKVPNRTVDPDARKSRARVTANVRHQSHHESA